MGQKAWEKVKEGRQEITQQVIEMMKEQNTNWIQPWVDSYNRPYNPITKNYYHGANVLRLWAVSMAKQYEDPRWITFKQASDNDWKIKKGEKGVLCEYWNKKIKEVEDAETGEKKQEIIPILNTFYVFNAQQVEGMPALETVSVIQKYNGEYNKLADQLIASSECPVHEDKESRGAYYTPSNDSITLPDRSQFFETAGFVETLLHEMSHSTGHPSRLNRESIAAMTLTSDVPPNTKDENNINNYPLEELVAEFSSIMVEKDLGVTSSGGMKNHAAYLNSWIAALEKDENVLFRVILAADNAADRLIHNYEVQVETETTETKSETKHEHKWGFQSLSHKYKNIDEDIDI